MSAAIQFQLHPKLATLWTRKALVIGLVPLIPGTVISIVSGRMLVIPIALLISALLISVGLRYIPRYIASFRCELNDDGLLVAHGVWWHKESFIPRSRIQHTDVNQGPIGRHFGIASLKVFTAGTQLSELEVPGLAHGDALTLRDQLLGRPGRDSV